MEKERVRVVSLNEGFLAPKVCSRVRRVQSRCSAMTKPQNEEQKTHKLDLPIPGILLIMLNPHILQVTEGLLIDGVEESGRGATVLQCVEPELGDRLGELLTGFVDAGRGGELVLVCRLKGEE